MKLLKIFSMATIILTIIFQPTLNAQNLLRNPSFEDGNPNKPTDIDELHSRCRHWRRHDDAYRNGYTDSPDWFESAPNKLRGRVDCFVGGTTTLNLPPAVPSPPDGTHFAGIVKEHDNQDGEGVQQKLRRKLNRGYYTLNFEYLLSCDTSNYGVKIYFGKTASRLDFLAKEFSIPTQNIGQWQHASLRFSIPNEWNNKLDWFILLADGTSPVNGTSARGAYMYIDNIGLRESPCTTCDPTGLISWNDNSIRPYMTPNSDGVFDQWCMTNINNASWYELEVYDRWGSTVYSENASDPNGFENLTLCWDGRNNQSQMLNVPNEYQIRVRLGNCGTQTTNLYQVFTSNDLAHDTFSVAQHYVPPLFGLNTPPTHFKNLDLYGGVYYGTHDWFACDSIFIGGSGEARVPYFIAGSTSDLGFYSTEGTFIDLGDTDFHAGSDIDINPQHVQCCPPLRLQNPDLTTGPLGDLDTLPAVDLPIEIVENITKDAASDPIGIGLPKFELEVFPSPVNDVLRISFYLPDAGLVSVRLVNSAGVSISEVLDDVFLEAGSHAYSVSVKALPAGVYVLRFGMGEGLPRPESFREVVEFRKVVVLD